MQQREDRPPYVKWERRAIEDRAATQETGSYKTKDIDFAIVTPIGSTDRIPRQADEYFKQLEQQVTEGRFKPEWLEMLRQSYAHWLRNEEMPLNGTPIKGWPVLSPAQQSNVISASILTVEDLAQANDEARKRIGMGANELVTKAISWLKAAKDLGKVTQEVTALKIENEGLKNQVKHQAEQLQALAAKLKALTPNEKAAA